MQDTGDSRRFAVFLIARVGAQIYDTGLVYPIDRNSTDVSFNDVLLFSKMPPYFELKLELYSFLLSDQSMVAGHKKVGLLLPLLPISYFLCRSCSQPSPSPRP